jgi:hypothetical protein
MFHENDDLSCWFGVCFIEEYEALETKEEKADWRTTRLGSAAVLKEMAEPFLEATGVNTSSPFAAAVMNSVDWVEVLEVVSDTIEVYEAEEEYEADDTKLIGVRCGRCDTVLPPLSIAEINDASKVLCCPP